jgi:hypothetical protein
MFNFLVQLVIKLSPNINKDSSNKSAIIPPNFNFLIKLLKRLDSIIQFQIKLPL